MKTAVVLFGLLAVGLATEDTANKEREARQYMIQPSYQFSNVAKNPYLLPANYNPLFRQIFPTSSKSTATVMTTTTSTITASITCTLSTTACAAGRRRRHVLADLIDKQSEKVEASPVIPIEATASPTVDDNRDRREANPQHYLNPLYNPSSSFAEQLSAHPLLKQTPFTPLNTLIQLVNDNIFKNPMLPPVISNNSPLDMIIAILNGEIPNVWLPGQSSSSSATVTMTQTSCVVAVKTITSTPSCSTPGTLFECPASTVASG